MKQFTRKPDLDAFTHPPIDGLRGAGLAEPPRERPPADQQSAPSSEQLDALAGMTVELAEYAVGMHLVKCRERVLELRTSLDHLYPTSVWPDTTMELGGRFAWALRERIARRLRDLE